jgi:hypothetical protein
MYNSYTIEVVLIMAATLHFIKFYIFPYFNYKGFDAFYFNESTNFQDLGLKGPITWNGDHSREQNLQEKLNIFCSYFVKMQHKDWLQKDLVLPRDLCCLYQNKT